MRWDVLTRRGQAGEGSVTPGQGVAMTPAGGLALAPAEGVALAPTAETPVGV